MNICVFCGSSAGNQDSFSVWAKELGMWIGQSGNTLVYGGSASGLMKIVAESVLACGGRVVGVIPNVELIRNRQLPGLTEILETGSISERKQKMIELSDAFIALPGGPGTLDEITDVVTLARVGESEAPCVLFDGDGYYQPLQAVFDGMVRAGFAEEVDFRNLLLSSDLREIEAFILNKTRK